MPLRLGEAQRLWFTPWLTGYTCFEILAVFGDCLC
jgi:hypothetical protein